MKIKITKAKNLSNNILKKLGFSEKDSQLITMNLIDAELACRKSHGLIRLPEIKTNIARCKVNTIKKDIKIIKETPFSLLIDAKYKPGPIPIYKSLDLAIEKVKTSGLIIVGIQNIASFSGFIGSYACKTVESNLIFIGFNNAAGLVPYGSNKKLLGTNPITIGVPTNNIPVILDMACSKITWGDVLIAIQKGKKMKEGVALDKNGKPTINPEKALNGGGLLPIAGHKGSGLAFIVELLAGVLTGARISYSAPRSWGTFYILIDPTLFRPLKKFKDDVEKAIKELKKAPTAKGFTEIYFPGEKSNKLRKKNLQAGEIKISDNLYSQLQKLIS